MREKQAKEAKAIKEAKERALRIESELKAQPIVEEPQQVIQKKEMDDTWTQDQQVHLQTGLKTYPSSDPERWTKIAADVPGKSKKECVARYKEIVAALKSKKAV